MKKRLPEKALAGKNFRKSGEPDQASAMEAMPARGSEATLAATTVAAIADPRASEGFNGSRCETRDE
jgi:hypothetical protein